MERIVTNLKKPDRMMFFVINIIFSILIFEGLYEALNEPDKLIYTPRVWQLSSYSNHIISNIIDLMVTLGGVIVVLIASKRLFFVFLFFWLIYVIYSLISYRVGF